MTLNKEYYILPESLAFLIQLLVSDQETSLRQLAAVQAKALVPRHWGSIAKDQKPGLRGRLIDRTLHEEEKLVRHGASRVIAAIAKMDFEDTEWEELIPTLLKVGTDSSVQARDASTFILASIIESTGETMLHQIKDILPLFARTISDHETSVRANTMLALCQIAIIVDPENDPDTLHAIQDSIPRMVDILKTAISNSDEDRALQAFEVFSTLLSVHPEVLNKHFRDLIQLMTHIAGETECDEDYRSGALNFLMEAVQARKLKVQSLKVGEQMTLRSLEIATELADDADEDEIDPPR